MKTRINFIRSILFALIMAGMQHSYAQCTPSFNYITGNNGLVSFYNVTPTTSATYTWNFGNATGSTVQAASVNYTANGIYNVVLTISTPTCGILTASAAISVSNACGLVPNFIYSQLTNGNVSFTNTSYGATSGATYTWNFGNSSTSTVTSPIANYSVNGSYVATLTANNASSTCLNSKTGTVTVTTNSNSCVLVPAASFTQALNGFVNFNSTSTGTTTNSTYTWFFGDNTTSTLTAPAHTYSANGIYTVILAVNNNTTPACSGIYTFTVNVNTYCSLNANFNYTVGAGGNVQFISTSTGTNSPAYLWNFGNNYQVPNAMNSNTAATVYSNGTYTVSLTVTNTIYTSCIDTVFAVITITNSPCALVAGFGTSTISSNTQNFYNSSVGMSNNATLTLSFGDASSSATLPVAHSYTAAGFYTRTLFINNNSVPTCTSSVTGTVNITSVCFLSANFTYSLGNNGLVNFFNASTGTIGSTSYSWNFGNSATSTSVNPSITYSANGTYTVSLSAANGTLGCTSSTLAVITITNIFPCNLTAGFSFSNATNGFVNFYNGSTGTVSSTTYTWNFGGGSTSTLVSPGHTYTLNGVYIVTLTASNNYTPACTSTYTMSVSVNNVCNLTANFTYTQSSGGIVAFSNSSAGTNSATSYSWNFGNSLTSTLSAPTSSFANGTYSVTLLVTNTGVVPTCTQSVTKVIVVTSNICALSTSFSHTVGSGGQVNFVSTTSGTFASTTYTWNFGDGYTSNNMNPTHTYQNGGAHLVSIIARNSSSCADTTIQSVNITGINCSANANFSVVPTGTAQYWYAIPAYPWNVTNAVWSWGDNSTSSGLYSSHQYSVAGNYNICLSVTVSCASSSSTCLTYSVYKPSGAANIINVNVIDPAPKIETGVYEISAGVLDFRVYPNPSDGIFYLETGDINQEKATLSVYNFIGQKIMGGVGVTSNGVYTMQLDPGTVPAGIYFVELRAGSKTCTKKIVISN